MSKEEAYEEYMKVKRKEMEEHMEFVKNVEDLETHCFFCDKPIALSGKKSQYWILIYEGKCDNCSTRYALHRPNIPIEDE